MIREIENKSSKTQEPGPAPLRRAPVELVLVVVVVLELWYGAFSIFIDVARRPAHFCRVGSAFVVATSRRPHSSLQQCYVRRAGKLEAMRCWPQRAVPEYVSPPANPTSPYAPRMPLRSGQSDSISLASLFAGKARSAAASLRVPSGTYGQGGAGKASAASSDRAS